MMMHVSAFRELYGDFGFVWSNVYRVELKDELDCYSARCYRSDGSVLSVFSFILHDSKYVLHGIYTQYNLRGLPQTIKHYKHGKLHNEEGPAHYYWSSDGAVIFKAYYINEKLHREDGPARHIHYTRSNLTTKSWFQHGKHFIPEFTKKALNC